MPDIDIPAFQFWSSDPSEAQDNALVNSAQFEWLTGQLDTGTYEDILENLTEIRNPRAYIDSVCHFYQERTLSIPMDFRGTH